MPPSAETHSHSTGQNGKHHMSLGDAKQDLLKVRQDESSPTCGPSKNSTRQHSIEVENISQDTVSLPNTSGLRGKITDAFVSTLWDNLQHPPLFYLGDQFKYRTADGSYDARNCTLISDGWTDQSRIPCTPISVLSVAIMLRTVTPQHPRPTVLPDPSLIFDNLFHTDERHGTRVKNSPTSISGRYMAITKDEAKKPFYPGSGLCPGFTISAAILSDAVALVRGDRFYTVDYSPANLTNFGLVVYLAQDLLGGARTFQITGHDYMVSGDSAANAEQRRSVNECIYEPKTVLEDVRKLYESITTGLLHEESFKLRDCYHVDIVQDVGNLAHAHFCSQFFSIPLKDSKDHSPDAYTPRELSDALFLLSRYVFLDLEPTDSLKTRIAAAADAQRMGAIMARSASNARDRVVRRFMQALGGARPVEGSVDKVVWTIIPTAAAACANQAQGWAQMLGLYLSDKYASHWPDIQKLARSTDPGVFDKLNKYGLEGYDLIIRSLACADMYSFRLSTPAFGVLRTAVEEATIKDGEATATVHRGDTIFVDFITAGRGPVKFTDPEQIRLDRPADIYIHHGWGPHACLGRAIVTTAGASLLCGLGRLENIRRVPGPVGEM
ncbi:cytochrome P450 [Aspergillus novofumigatus IBT 16806]|uniref:Cytochrome P450 n=1 Tax=Aspergillus novofumigatus (strain IBT 16806) TaxID=1392255 RepID=A0A2I1BU62_ASPN1|nr:cytochrome P450 [Aspergillus novofumigatus IBT 16806]PKX88947.1 cytochrome P450 [Aspergillus novofumigatus IBT 16806]